MGGVNRGRLTASRRTAPQIPMSGADMSGWRKQSVVAGEGDADMVRFVRTMDAIGANCAY
jgi:hypothetical protein